MGNITNEKFTMQSVPCECLIDVTHDETGAEKRTLKIKEIHGTVYTYAYEAKEGLVRIDPETGGVISKNVLGELLSIKPADTNGLMNFFRKNGFFTPLSSSSYSAFDFEDLFCVLKRIQETLHLMNMTQGSYIQYKKMLHVISWLVLSDRITLCAVEGEHPQLETCIHGYKDELLRISRESYTVTPFDPAAYESNQSEVTVYDSIINGQTSVSMSDYESRIAGAQMFGDYEQSDILLSKYAAATLFLYHQDIFLLQLTIEDYPDFPHLYKILFFH